MTGRGVSRPVIPFLLLGCLAGRGTAAAETATGAVLTREQKPVYPEGLLKIQKQGNVLLIGRIDTQGRVRDPQAIATTNIGFVDPALSAVKAWQFKPATRAGKPVDVAVNIGIRFRLEGKKRGEIPRPALGDLAVFPADAAGKKTSPDGFPIRRGRDPRVRVEAVLDVAPLEKAQRLAVRADAVSPKNRRIGIYEGNITVPAKAMQVAIPFTAAIGNDWEDGIWQLQFSVANSSAGGGQFWLAGDPEHFDFAGAMARSPGASLGPTARPVAPPAASAAPAGRAPATAAPRRK